MKKITLFGAMLISASSLFSQSQFKWNGSQTIQDWDYATANWLDPSFPIPIPKTFTDGTDAIFDDSSVEGSDTIKVNGTINVDSIKINATKTYVIRRTADTDGLTGNGALIKDGAGTFVMNVKNSLLRGTVIRDGKIIMESADSPNVFGDTLRCEGGSANLGTAGSTSSKKVTFKSTLIVPDGKTINLELARYSYLGSKVIGNGTINLLCAGERTFLGYESLANGITQFQPNWNEFTGSIKVSKLVTNVTPGFWGLMLNTSKLYKDSLEFGFNVDSTLYNKKVTIGSGAILASHSGTKAYAIGELNAEDNTSLLVGYRSESATPKIYYFVGGLNTDVIYPGRICQAPGLNKHYNHVSFVKVGTGTYTFTHPNNDIIGGLQIRQGRIFINSDILKGQYYGGVGSFAYVYKNGTLGGSGRIGGNVDIFGKLQPGVNGIGILLINDSISASYKSKYDLPLTYSIKYTNPSKAATSFTYKNGGTGVYNLNLHAGSVTEFEIGSATSYDKVIASGKLKFGVDSTSIGKPKIKIIPANGIVINDGDRFEIIKTRSIDALSSGFDIEYPSINGITWSVETKADSVKYEKEEFTFTDHIKTFYTADSIVTTIVSPDTMMYSYKVIVTAHGSTAINTPKDNTLSVYPNPAVGEVTISSSDAEITSVQIINLQGQVILNKKVLSTIIKLNLDNLPSGIYYTKIITSKGTKIQKLILQ